MSGIKDHVKKFLKILNLSQSFQCRAFYLFFVLSVPRGNYFDDTLPTAVCWSVLLSLTAAVEEMLIRLKAVSRGGISCEYKSTKKTLEHPKLWQGETEAMNILSIWYIAHRRQTGKYKKTLFWRMCLESKWNGLLKRKMIKTRRK